MGTSQKKGEKITATSKGMAIGICVGVAIGAAFVVSPSTGIVAAIAIAFHEIPQEIGDFGLLPYGGVCLDSIHSN